MPLQRKPETNSVTVPVGPAAVKIILVPSSVILILLYCAAGRKMAEITQVNVYFDRYSPEATECICQDSVVREIHRTMSIEEAAVFALEELAKGPREAEYAKGYRSCLPSGGTIARYEEWYIKIVKAYQKDGKIDYFGKKFLSPEGEFTPWGDKITVRGVKIKDGTAYADFSKELYSYGGGSCFVKAIETSIVNTLKQFPQVEKVVILVEGRETEIEP